ncbi:MAG: hypothetical protein MJZ04_03330 [Bacteroidales bacterium]|nr:hypothetical protein [Bacteroidales bacterium]
MRKISFFAALLAAVITVSCSEKECNPSSDSTITFICEKPLYDVATKTEWTGNTIQWSKGDQVRIGYTVDGVWQNANGDATDGKPRFYASSQLAEPCSKAEFSLSTSFKGDTQGSHVFYGLYPSAKLSSTDQANAPVINISLSSTQEPSADSFDSREDVLLGKSLSNYASRPTEVAMEWVRVVAHSCITFTNIPLLSGETIKSIKLEAQEEAALTGKFSANLFEKTLNAANPVNSVQVNVEQLSVSDNSLKVWFVTAPFTATSLVITISTNDDTQIVRSIDRLSLNFEANRRNTLTINMASASRKESIANTEETAYSTSQAIALIDSAEPQLSTTEVFVKGTISTVESFNESYGSITYWLDDDTFEVFGGLSKEGSKFLGLNDLVVGDQVVVKGKLLKFGSTYEMDKNNVIVSRKTASTQTTPSLSLPSSRKTSMKIGDPDNEYNVDYSGDGVLTASSSNTDVAMVSIIDSKVTVKAVGIGSTTITVSAPATSSFYATATEYVLEVSGDTDFVALFGSEYNSKGVSSYTGSFSATNDGFTVNVQNFNNNNNSWTYIKTGNKTNASVGTITTNEALSKAISEVSITIDAITSGSVNSIKLYSGSSASAITTEEGTFTLAAGTQTVKISTPTANRFYRISFDCQKGSSNGLVTVSKIVFK